LINFRLTISLYLRSKYYSHLSMARKILVPVLLLFPYLVCFGQDTDIELWLAAQVRTDFVKKFRFYYEQGYRRDEFLAKTKTFYFETGGFYKPWKFLWVGPYYRYYNDFSGSSLNHLSGVLLLREELKRLDLKSRTRYIVQFGGGNETDHYLRERISAGYDIRKIKFTPFIASEFIFHLQPVKTEIEQIRFDTGLDRDLGRHHSIELYYRYCIQMNVHNPVNSHIIGINYVFEL
jgi:hypothetical protein